jgi:hypothetical protein
MYTHRALAVVAFALSLHTEPKLAHAQTEPPQPQPAAATVTLTVANAPLSQVLAEVAKQTGMPIENQLGDPEPRVSLDLRPGQPFWKAIDLIAERSGARVVVQQRAGRIVLARRLPDERKPIISYSGPFRFCVKGVESRWAFETDTRTAVADVEVAWEPRLRALFLDTIALDVVGFDAERQPHPVPAAGRSKAPVDGSTSLIIKVPLPLLPRSTASLGRLEGRLEAIAPTKMLRFRFPTLDQLNAASPGSAVRQITQEGVTCKVTRVLLKDRWIVQMAIENPPGGTILESYQPWDTNNEMALVSKDGRTRIVAKLSARERESSRRADIVYLFADRDKLAEMKPEEWSLEYETPALIVTMPLAFSFRDVPLP